MYQADDRIADSIATDEVPSVGAAATTEDVQRACERRGAGIWWLVLLLVIVFGYISATRRESLGRFVEQLADIVRDFRGYDPEF